MAVLDFNADEKYRAYHVLACLNRSFQRILFNLGELKKAGVVNTKQLKILRGISQELQADINFHSLERLHAVELKDWHRFGRVRIQRDRKKR
ncbi:MAG TPA: hypothetical protein VI685_20055 [Candidatus Angelobacter sp.]